MKKYDLNYLFDKCFLCFYFLLENGDIKLKTKDSPKNDVPQQNSNTSKTVSDPGNRENASTGEQNIAALLTKDKNANEINPGKDNDIQSAQPPTANASVQEDKSRPQNSDENRDDTKTQAPAGVPGKDNAPPPGEHSPRTGFGDVSSMIGLNQRELAEKKKQQWKKELGE